MNFLQLVRRLSQEAQIPGEGPSTVVGQTGENRSLVNWVNSAWEEIQMMQPDWLWLKGSFSFTTTENQALYTPAAMGISGRFSSWDLTSFRIYETALGENNSTELPFLDYPTYRSFYLTNTQAPGRPVIYSVAPNRSVYLGPKPNDTVFTIMGEYNKSIQTLVADNDVPELPSEYHMIIVYLALMKYARAEAAGEIYADAKEEFRKFKHRLSINQLPAVSMAGATV